MHSTAIRPNGNGHAVGAAPVAALVDRLHDIRDTLKRLTAEERQATGALVEALQTLGLREAVGATARASLTTRTVLTVDPGLFVEAVGLARALPALSVSVTAARHLVGADDLAAISETATVPVLRVDRR